MLPHTYWYIVSREKTLITGGTGFIGSFLAKDLVDDGHEVVLFDKYPTNHFIEKLDIAEEVDIRRGDVVQLRDIIDVVKETNPSRIIHLAALLTDGLEDDPRLGTRINIIGFNNILETADILDHIERVVWASSTTVYAPADNYSEPVNESDLVYPDTLYGGTKVYNEIMAEEYDDDNLTVVGIRPSLTYGPYRQTGGSTFLTDIIEKAALGESYSVDYGDQVVNWHYIKDAVQAFRKAAFIPDGSINQTKYNTGGEAATVGELANMVKEIIPDSDIDVSNEGELPWMQEIDISNARKDLDYDPEYDLKSGVEEYIQIVRKENDLSPI